MSRVAPAGRRAIQGSRSRTLDGGLDFGVKAVARGFGGFHFLDLAPQPWHNREPMLALIGNFVVGVLAVSLFTATLRLSK